MTIRIGRRELITALGGGMVAWPLTAHAQQPSMPVVGFLDSGLPDGMTANLAAFQRGLGETGYTEGTNVTIEYRWARGHYDQLPVLAAELVRRQVAVIAATRSPAPALAAKAATSTIPIVFQTGSDPVKDGLVASLNRPGGNVTGASRLATELIPKRLGILSELAPKGAPIAMLIDPVTPEAKAQMQEMREATHSLGVVMHVVNASADSELDAAFAAIVQNHDGALIVANAPLFMDSREHLTALALHHAIPTMFDVRESVVAGGLMSYAASFSDSFRQVGVYVGRILKGAKPADLPIQQPVKFDLVINLKTAKALGLTIPHNLLVLADEVIE